MDEPLPHTQVKDQRAWGPYWICWKHKAGEPLKITQHRSDLFNQMLPHPPRVWQLPRAWLQQNRAPNWVKNLRNLTLKKVLKSGIIAFVA